MGQYYKPVNIDKMEHLYSHDFDNGLKLMEHSYIGNNFVGAVERLLSPDGSWHKCKLCWAGDYMNDGLLIPKEIPAIDKDGNATNLLCLVSDNNVLYGGEAPEPDYSDYEKEKAETRKVTKAFLKNLPKAGKYLTNHTKCSYLDLTKEKGAVYSWSGSELIIHPLPLLTCSGNGRGGGDYHGSEMGIVGCWAGDVISIERRKPTGYTLLDPINFIEGDAEEGIRSDVSITYEKKKTKIEIAKEKAKIEEDKRIVDDIKELEELMG